MDRENKIFQVSEIVSKYILGNITDHEKEQLEHWLQESPRHKELFEDMVLRETMSEKVQAYKRVDWQRALDDLLKRKQGFQRERNVRRIRRYMKYVAVLVLPLGIVLYMYMHRGKTPEVQQPKVEAQVLIPAGKPKATLQLASGEEIALTTESSRHIEQGNGVVIKQNFGVIEYKVDGNSSKENEQFNTISVPRGGEFCLTLSDGTRVWLNADSRLRYPVEFVGKKRKVYLEGEAYFDVSYDEHKQFVVETKDARVKVYGTAFDVSAYEDEKETTATLVRGSIALKSGKTDKMIRLEPGEQGRLQNGKLTKQNVDVRLYTAWVEGRLVFNSVRLEDMLRRLSRWYDVNVIFSRDELKEVIFTGEVKKYKDFSEVLDVIESTQTVHFEVKDGTIIVY